MYKLLIVMVACVFVAFAAGCNKGESTENRKAGGQAVAGESRQDGAAGQQQEEPVTFEDWQAAEDAKYPPLTESETETIRAGLIKFAPQFKFDYDPESGLLSGEGIPADGLPLDVLVDKLSWEVRRSEIDMAETNIDKLYQRIYGELIPQPEPPAKTPAETERERIERSERVRSGAEAGAAGQDKNKKEDVLSYISNPIGEWKSIREENPRITTYHDDKYFSFLQIMHDDVAFFKVYRDKQMSNYKEFTWEYDNRTGRLELLDDQGLLSMTFTLRVKDNDNDTLYTEQPGDYSTVVYTRIGTGYPPEPIPGEPGPGGVRTEDK